MSETYTEEEVAKHNTKEDCWIIVNGGVYDVTKFAPIHPGGAALIMTVKGKDATEYFNELHKESILEEVGADYKIGTVAESAGGKSRCVVTTPAGTPAEQQAGWEEEGYKCGIKQAQTVDQMHSHPYDARIHVIKGKVTVHVDGVNHVLEAGDSAELGADIEHNEICDGDVELLVGRRVKKQLAKL